MRFNITYKPAAVRQRFFNARVGVVTPQFIALAAARQCHRIIPALEINTGNNWCSCRKNSAQALETTDRHFPPLTICSSKRDCPGATTTPEPAQWIHFFPDCMLPPFEAIGSLTVRDASLLKFTEEVSRKVLFLYWTLGTSFDLRGDVLRSTASRRLNHPCSFLVPSPSEAIGPV